MKSFVFLIAAVIVFLIAGGMQAVVIERPVTRDSIKEHPGEFSVKAHKRDDGLIQFTVEHQLKEPQYFVASLTLRQGDQLIAEINFPSYVRESKSTWYFAVAPGQLDKSVFELAERSFVHANDQDVPMPGGVDYQIHLKDFAP